MAEDVRATGADQGTNGGEPEKTFTQEEVNAIVGKRLHEEKEKYADYDELKNKAAKYDEAEEASKSELQKATERAEGLQKEVDKMKRDKRLHEIRAKVAKETGVSPDRLLTLCLLRPSGGRRASERQVHLADYHDQGQWRKGSAEARGEGITSGQAAEGLQSEAWRCGRFHEAAAYHGLCRAERWPHDVVQWRRRRYPA